MTISNTSSRRLQRALEILPGFVSWNLILFPIWGAFVFPLAVAYFILAFDIFWLYKSVAITIASLVSYTRIKASQQLDWMKEVKEFPDWAYVNHLVIITTYKEPLHTLQRTLRSLASQTCPKASLLVAAGFEHRESSRSRREKETAIKKEFAKKFGLFFTTTHVDKPGETIGKHSNARSIVLRAKEKLRQNKCNFDYLTVSSCDADHVYHPQHFAYLTYKFLDSPARYERIWQPAIVFYNNFWKLPSLTRVANTFCSIWNTALLARTDRLVNQQNYSLSWKLLESIDFWDPEVIPEDYRIFFKAFF